MDLSSEAFSAYDLLKRSLAVQVRLHSSNPYAAADTISSLAKLTAASVVRNARRPSTGTVYGRATSIGRDVRTCCTAGTRSVRNEDRVRANCRALLGGLAATGMVKVKTVRRRFSTNEGSVSFENAGVS